MKFLSPVSLANLLVPVLIATVFSPIAIAQEPQSAAPAKELLKISELAERADVPVATVHHYLREGLLPEPVKTSTKRRKIW